MQLLHRDIRFFQGVPKLRGDLRDLRFSFCDHERTPSQIDNMKRRICPGKTRSILRKLQGIVLSKRCSEGHWHA